jgi:magnesium transporter
MGLYRAESPMDLDTLGISPTSTADEIATLASGMHVADIVELLNARPIAQRLAILEKMTFERTVATFDQAGLDDSAALIAGLPEILAPRILQTVSIDRAAEIFRQLREPERGRLLNALDVESKGELDRVLGFPRDSAGSIMTTEFVSVPSTHTVAETIEHIRRVESTRESVYAIYVFDPATRALVQSISLRRLITGNPADPVLSVAYPRPPITVAPLTDREDVARLISKYDLLAMPVIDAQRRVIGIVTVDDVIDAMVAETTEDVQKFGGVEALNAPYMQIGFGQMIYKRAGWLCALFLSEMLTASAMQHFEGELEKAVVLTLFIPLIMSSGGNSGSQATSLLIRAIALGEVRLHDWWKVALRELPTGLTLGAILGVIGFARITIWQKLGIYDYGVHWPLVAATVGAALVGIVTFGSLSGSMLPFAMKRLGFDPASASAPFVATLVDVTGLVIYFSVALVILGGTLL